MKQFISLYEIKAHWVKGGCLFYLKDIDPESSATFLPGKIVNSDAIET